MIENFASRLKQLRTDKHLRQEQVATLIGVTKSAISAYENDLRQPSYVILVRLATLYQVSTDYLLGCANKRSIDISGLTPMEAALISEMVDSMAVKNRKLEELR